MDPTEHINKLLETEKITNLLKKKAPVPKHRVSITGRLHVWETQDKRTVISIDPGVLPLIGPSRSPGSSKVIHTSLK